MGTLTATQPVRTRRSGLVAIVVILVSGLMMLTGCSDSSDSTVSGPTSIGRSIDMGGVGGAPVPDASKPSGQVSVDGSTTTQSFKVTGQGAEEAITSYETTASSAGWKTTEVPDSTGSTDWSLTMEKGGSTLLVTASPAAGDSGNGEEVTELSIEVTAD